MSIRQKLFGKSGFVFGYFTIRQRLRKHIRFFCFLRRHPMLIDDTERGLGKRNTLKCGTVIWRCNFRPKINSCPGLDAQLGNKFVEKRQHTCNPKQHLKKNTILSAKAKAYALNNIRELTLKIVEPMIVETLEKKKQLGPYCAIRFS